MKPRGAAVAAVLVAAAYAASLATRVLDPLAAALSAIMVVTGAAMLVYARVGIVVLVPLLAMLWQAVLLMTGYGYLRVMGRDGPSVLALGVSGLAGLLMSLAAFVEMLVEVLGGAREAPRPRREAS